MNHALNFSRGSRLPGWLAGAGLACGILSLGSPASAQVVTLTSGNSSSQIDLGSQAGMFNWLIDGVNVLNQQTFFTRTNPLGTASPVSSLGAPTVSQPTVSSVSATYTSASFNVTTVYNLVGQTPGSGTSDLSEQIKIQNNTAAPLVFNFFQFAAFAGNGNVTLGTNSHGFFNEAFITGAMIVTENLDTGISPGANDGAIGDPATILTDITGTPGYTPSGPDTGTGAWALEWERTLNPNSSLIISKDLSASGVIAPEPPAWSLVSMGLVALGAVKHYRSRRGK